VAARHGYLDEIIEPSETREKLLTAFRLLESKRVRPPAKKHGNIPL
jgi:propionyl-CoA carboxylase beta chain